MRGPPSHALSEFKLTPALPDSDSPHLISLNPLNPLNPTVPSSPATTTHRPTRTDLAPLCCCSCLAPVAGEHCLWARQRLVSGCVAPPNLALWARLAHHCVSCRTSACQPSRLSDLSTAVPACQTQLAPVVSLHFRSCHRNSRGASWPPFVNHLKYPPSNGSTLGSDSPHSPCPTSGIWRFSDPLLVVAAGCCCVCAQSDSPIRSRIVLSTSSNRQRCIADSFVQIIVILVLSSSCVTTLVCATPSPSPRGVGSSSPVLLDRPPLRLLSCCYRPVRLVSTRCRRRRRRNRLVLSKLPLRCCQLASDILVLVRFLGQRFLFNPVNFNLKCCTRCTRCTRVNDLAVAAFNLPRPPMNPGVYFGKFRTHLAPRPLITGLHCPFYSLSLFLFAQRLATIPRTFCFTNSGTPPGRSASAPSRRPTTAVSTPAVRR